MILKLEIILVFSLFIIVNSQITQFLIPSEQNNSRFSKIYVPENRIFAKQFLQEIHNETVFVTPTKQVYKFSELTELCSEAKNNLEIFPEFNQTNERKICEKYFCTNESTITRNLGNATLKRDELLYFQNLHIMAHRYCIQCNDTSLENFQNKTCQWFNQEYCGDYCSSTCIYYRYFSLPIDDRAPKLNLCHRNSLNLFFSFQRHFHA
jgi:hypothetical protein